MLNNYYYSFRFFDPLKDALPEPYAVMFNEINYRSRKLLEKFDSEQIKQAALKVNEIIKDKNFVDPLEVARKKELIPTPMFGKIYDVYQVSNNVESIYENIPNISIKEYVELEGFEWTHLFAVISLFYSDLVKQLLHSQSNHKLEFVPKMTDERILEISNELVIEAKQAQTIAELLINQEATFKQRKSKQSRSAINLRFEKTTKPLEKLVISVYEEKFQSLSNRSAASKIFNELSLAEKIHFDASRNVLKFNGIDCLNNDDPEHRFEKWIGQYKKNKSES